MEATLGARDILVDPSVRDLRPHWLERLCLWTRDGGQVRFASDITLYPDLANFRFTLSTDTGDCKDKRHLRTPM